MRMPWRKSPDRVDHGRGAASGGPDGVTTLAEALRERGVTESDARSLAEKLGDQVEAQSRGGRGAFVDGIAASWHAMSEARARLDRSVSDIKEVERLMGAFTGELSKLDEVLEVLAAYVRRMRTSKSETSEGQTLH